MEVTRMIVVIGPVLVGLAAYLLIGIAMIVGAVRMLRLQSYGWATTASILALLPCSPAGVLGVAMGIWSLIVLSRPDVRAAFGRAPQQSLGLMVTMLVVAVILLPVIVSVGLIVGYLVL
jgi:hypothetical protein